MTASNGELDFVRWLGRRLGRGRAGVVLGVGDDMAIVRAGESRILLTADMLLDGVHFDTRVHALPLIGRKAIACSLSDCAAMAVKPLCATVSVALNEHLSLLDAQALLEGVIARTLALTVRFK